MSIAFAHRPHFAHALHSRPFALLWTGQTISALGDGAFVTALSWQALQLTGSAMAMVIVNFGLAVYQILWVTVMQEIVPDDRLGRVSSIDQLGGYGLWPVGFVLAGVVADHISPSWVFIGAGILNIGLYSFGLCARAVRRLQ